MKKLGKYLLLFLMLFMFFSEVNAASITWKQITDEFKTMMEEYEEYTITSDDKFMKIDYKEIDEEDIDGDEEEYTNTIDNLETSEEEVDSSLDEERIFNEA